MFGKLKLGVKLIIYMSFMLVTTMTIISYITFNASKKELLESISDELHLTNELKIEKINSYFKNIESSFDYISRSKDLQFLISDYIRIIASKKSQETLSFSDSLQLGLVRENLNAIQESYRFNRVMLLTIKGEVVYQSAEIPYLKAQDYKNFGPDSKFLIDARTELSYSNIYQPPYRKNEYYMMAAAPIKNNRNTTIGIIACELIINPLFNVITEQKWLGSTGETFLTQKTKNRVRFISPLKYSAAITSQENELSFGEPFGIPAQESATRDGFGFATQVLDYNKQPVDAAWNYIPKLEWGIVTKINHEDSFKSILYLRVLIIFLCCTIIFFAIIFIAIFVKKFLKPIIDIRDNMFKLASGHFPDYIEYENADEIKETTDAMNDLITRLKYSTDFAQRIGKGDLNVRFEYAKGEDVLSKSLISMRENLSRIEGENEKRKWATEGIALHGEIVRKNNQSIEELSKAFISSLTEYIDAQHGGVYVISQLKDAKLADALNNKTHFKLAAKYAHNFEVDTSEAQQEFELGQGLIGQCALEKELIYIKNKKLDIAKISSGLGESHALHVLFTPLLVNQEIMGVIELASFHPFEDYKIEFIKKVSESIASAILSLKSAEQTQVLLEESRKITSTLREKEEGLVKEHNKMLQEIAHLKEDNKVAQNIINKLKKSK